MNDLKVLAFYLPQYHPIPENDAWWGKGFTEWTNVGKAKPMFRGHYQPHVPADLGYYDLRLPQVREAQADMARTYGIDGFCYWHYWLGGGRRLLEAPFEAVLRTGTPDFPFCLGWANHSWVASNWSAERRDDGRLIEQTYPGIEDVRAHFFCVLEAFRDERYLKVDGAPLFVVWEPLHVPRDLDFLGVWRRLARENGFPDVYFMGCTWRWWWIRDVRELGYDAVVYDGLHDTYGERRPARRAFDRLYGRAFNVPRVIRYSDYARVSLRHFAEHDCVPSVLPNYDHTPRSGRNGDVLLGTPDDFRELLAGVAKVLNQRNPEHPFLMVKSWNEWGEGNHLEPDLRHGHAFLSAVKDFRHSYTAPGGGA